MGQSITKKDLQVFMNQMLSEINPEPNMLNLIKWNKNCYEIVFEKYSFYYVHKMIVAFRRAGENNTNVPDNKMNANDIQRFLDSFVHIGGIVKIAPTIFRQELIKAYKSALFEGVRRISVARLRGEEKQEDRKDVTD
jgi:hypothetical protein